MNNENCCIIPDSPSDNNLEINHNNDFNLQSTKTDDINYIGICNQNINECSQSTQTEFCDLYKYENKDDIEDLDGIEEEKIDKLIKRKRKTALIL